MAGRLLNIYRFAVVRHPWIALLLVLVPVAVLVSWIPSFRLNVASDAIILEDDPGLRVYDASRLIFGSDDYIIIAFKDDDVFSDGNIRLIADLTEELSAVDGVSDVMSITSEPLFLSPPLGDNLISLMMHLQGGDSVTLDSKACDRARAREELTTSGVWANNIVTPDGTCTAILAYLMQKSEGHEVERRIHEIDRRLEAGEGDAAALRAERRRQDARLQEIVNDRRDRRARVLQDVREVVDRFEDASDKTFYASGLPVIFVDMMTYVRRDIMLFGLLVVFFLTAMLGIVFRRLRWLVLPMAAGLVTVAAVVGTMVAAGIQTTVITSNLTSLLMILSMAHSIHFAVRYDEERALDPGGAKRDWILRAVRHIGVPCFYISATTAVGFFSLVISGIRPVIEFGQYMSLGVLLSFAVTFLVVPAGLMLWPVRDRRPPPPPSGTGLFQPLAALTRRHRWTVLLLGAALTVFSAVGISKLDVETIFADYFPEDTEIHKGLEFIDRELGGTSSLEVILTAEEEEYFCTWEHLERLRKIEDYLDDVPEVGKILSPVTLMDEMDRVLVAYGSPHPPGRDRHPAKTLLLPLTLMGGEEIGEDRAPLYAYMDPTCRIARVFIRIQETSETLDRKKLVDDLRAFLDEEIASPEVKAEVTGVFVLYANMLHSLFDGQAKTSLLVFAAILVMMVILFRSPRLGLLALVPNVVPIAFVLGLMGWVGVNLDANNIMIASMCLGIAVDDTLHYVFRYREEIQKDGDSLGAMTRTHNTIGKAIVLTSLVIVSGFIVLAFSNFIPTRNFGLFSSLAMVAALLAAMTLLPACLVIFKPIGRKGAPARKAGEGEEAGKRDA